MKQFSDNDYMARCPVHDGESLHVTFAADGKVLLHCFGGGCTYQDIIQAVEDQETMPAVRVKQPKDDKALANPREWWEDYTGIPWVEWERWGTRRGVDPRGAYIAFFWRSIQNVERIRWLPKDFRWQPEGAARPPFWPEMPKEMPKSVYITVGETDCGVLRHLGFEAYAETGGDSKELLPHVWAQVRLRGVEEIVLVPDGDSSSLRKLDMRRANAESAGLAVSQVDITRIVDPLLGEKDIREVWRRVGPDLADAIVAHTIPLTEHGAETWVDLDTFMGTPVPETTWLVEDILHAGTTGMFVAVPKIGKTWLTLDLAVSVASGLPFLGEYAVNLQGPVVVISKEDPDPLLQNRLLKILQQKGLAGSVTRREGKFRLRLPPLGVAPVIFDLGRDFVFDQPHIDRLLRRLDQVRTTYGGLALVTFDPLLKMMAEEGEKLYNAADVDRMFFKPAERIISEFGAAVLLVHHRGKGDSTTRDSYGSFAFRAASAASHYFLGDKPGKDGWVTVEPEFKSAVSGEKWSYRLGQNLKARYEPEVIRGQQALTRRDQVRDAVLVALRDGDALCVQDFIDATGASRAVIDSVLKDLVASAQVIRDDDGEIRATSGRRKNVFRLSQR